MLYLCSVKRERKVRTKNQFLHVELNLLLTKKNVKNKVMSILYEKVKRTVTVGRNPGQKYLAKVYVPSTIDEKQVAQDISDSTSLTYGDCLNAIRSLCEIISRYNRNSIRVRLSDLGTFSPAFHAQVQATLDDVTDDTIKRCYTRFYPSVYLDKSMKSTGVRLRPANAKGYQDPNA